MIRPEHIEQAYQDWCDACAAVDALPFAHPDAERLSRLATIANRELCEMEIAFYAQEGIAA